jgi:hypothetical protein
MTPTKSACSPAVAGGSGYRATKPALTCGLNRAVGRTQQKVAVSRSAQSGAGGAASTGSATALCRTDGWLAAQPDWRLHALEARAFLGLSLCSGFVVCRGSGLAAFRPS